MLIQNEYYENDDWMWKKFFVEVWLNKRHENLIGVSRNYLLVLWMVVLMSFELEFLEKMMKIVKACDVDRESPIGDLGNMMNFGVSSHIKANPEIL